MGRFSVYMHARTPLHTLVLTMTIGQSVGPRRSLRLLRMFWSQADLLAKSVFTTQRLAIYHHDHLLCFGEEN